MAKVGNVDQFFLDSYEGGEHGESLQGLMGRDQATASADAPRTARHEHEPGAVIEGRQARRMANFSKVPKSFLCGCWGCHSATCSARASARIFSLSVMASTSVARQAGVGGVTPH